MLEFTQMVFDQPFEDFNANKRLCNKNRQIYNFDTLNVDLIMSQHFYINTVGNYIKIRPLKSINFSALCKQMSAENSTLIFYCESRWLRHGKFLHVYEL